MKSLVVDDELVSRMKLKKILENFGPCVAVADGAGAIKAFVTAWQEHIPFDLVCLDIGMPGKDGTEVLFEIREKEQTMKVHREKPVRVMMTTAKKDKDSIVTSIQAGCDTYLLKPYNKKSVLERLKKLGFKVEADA